MKTLLDRLTPERKEILNFTPHSSVVMIKDILKRHTNWVDLSVWDASYLVSHLHRSNETWNDLNVVRDLFEK